MKKYIYKKSDAFTYESSLGNPAACIFTGQDILNDNEMLYIAKQHKGFVSEVVFCSNSVSASCKLTYYSSECEVDFCGHGTIATMYELLKIDENLRKQKEIRFETNKKGTLVLYNNIDTEDAVYITAPEAKSFDVNISVAEIAEALDVKESNINKDQPIAIIDAGLKTLIIPIASYECEISTFPCEDQLKTFCLNNGIDIILIYCLNTSSPEFIAHTRVFAPKFGYLEDPATGSGNSAFAYYLYENNLWNGNPVMIEQGGNDRVFNAVRLKMKEGKVLFGGKATLRIDGQYIL